MIKDAGIARVICNRPDQEIPPSHHAEVMASAAADAGLEFVILPLTHQTFTPENIAKHRDAATCDDGPVLAYCASGTRSTIVWALGQAGHLPTSDILSAARAGGYDLDHLEPHLEALAGDPS